MVLGGSLHILIRDWIRYDLQMYRDDSFFFFFFLVARQTVYYVMLSHPTLLYIMYYVPRPVWVPL